MSTHPAHPSGSPHFWLKFLRGLKLIPAILGVGKTIPMPWVLSLSWMGPPQNQRHEEYKVPSDLLSGMCLTDVDIAPKILLTSQCLQGAISH